MGRPTCSKHLPSSLTRHTGSVGAALCFVTALVHAAPARRQAACALGPAEAEAAVIVVVSGLPRGGSVEWQLLGATESCVLRTANSGLSATLAVAAGQGYIAGTVGSPDPQSLLANLRAAMRAAVSLADGLEATDPRPVLLRLFYDPTALDAQVASELPAALAELGAALALVPVVALEDGKAIAVLLWFEVPAVALDGGGVGAV